MREGVLCSPRGGNHFIFRVDSKLGLMVLSDLLKFEAVMKEYRSAQNIEVLKHSLDVMLKAR